MNGNFTLTQMSHNSPSAGSKHNKFRTFALAIATVSMMASTAKAQEARSSLLNQSGTQIGEAHYKQGTRGVVIHIKASGLSAGRHGMHFHNVGACDGETKFKSAKGHIAPSNAPHGYLHPEGPHEGNLPNLIVSADGTAEVEIYSTMVSVRDGPAALLDPDGSALVIHENPDDHMTQPIGGAGGRVACGVVEATN